MDEPGADQLDPEQREALLERIQRKTATIGEQIPETIDIDGEQFELRDFVWETKRQGRVPPERRDEVQRVRSRLQEEREQLKAKLKTDELTAAEGEALARTIVGIDRAITALKNLYETDLGERTHEEYVEGNRRWLAFIDQLTD